MKYYEGINQGDDYMCDRCNFSKLSFNEYNTNIRDIKNSDEKMRYCSECTNYIILKKWKCTTCNTMGTNRNEREIQITHCQKLVIFQ